jgi:hypothetical protein
MDQARRTRHTKRSAYDGTACRIGHCADRRYNRAARSRRASPSKRRQALSKSLRVRELRARSREKQQRLRKVLAKLRAVQSARF